MAVVCRIPQTHPHCAEIMRLLAGLEIPEHLSLTISQSTYPALCWELMVVSEGSVSVRCVSMNEGPVGVLSTAAKMVAVAKVQP